MTTDHTQRVTEQEQAQYRREVFALDEGEVTIYVPTAKLTALSITEFRDHCELIAQKLERRAGLAVAHSSGFRSVDAEPDPRNLRIDPESGFKLKLPPAAPALPANIVRSA